MRPRKTKIGTELRHVTRDSDTTFKVKGQRSTCRGRGHIVAASRTACMLSKNLNRTRSPNFWLFPICRRKNVAAKRQWQHSVPVMYLSVSREINSRGHSFLSYDQRYKRDIRSARIQQKLLRKQLGLSAKILRTSFNLHLFVRSEINSRKSEGPIFVPYIDCSGWYMSRILDRPRL